MKKALKYFPLVAAALALIALIVGLAAPAVVYDSVIGENVSYSGWKCTFGYAEKYSTVLGSGEVEVLSFSFWNLLTYILLLVGIVAAVLAFLKPDMALLGYVAAACFVGATVLFFCACPSTAFAGIKDTEIADLLSLGAGAIVGAILSILAVLAAAASPVLTLLNKKKIIKLK